MSKFNVGDKVIARTNSPYVITAVGSRGTVVGTLENPNGQFIIPGDDICVKSNNDGECYSVESKYFDLVPECNQKIVITNDGKTTTAKLYDGMKFVKAAKAICSPEDEFDFGIGAELAVERLLGNPNATLPDSIDWKAFKNDKVFVQVTKDNFDEFIEEAEKHDCFFHNHDKFNPFNHNRAFADLILIKMLDKDSAAPDGTLFVGYQDEKLKVASINTDNKTVFVW